jgi:hypothetical protein
LGMNHEPKTALLANRNQLYISPFVDHCFRHPYPQPDRWRRKRGGSSWWASRPAGSTKKHQEAPRPVPAYGTLQSQCSTAPQKHLKTPHSRLPPVPSVYRQWALTAN